MSRCVVCSSTRNVLVEDLGKFQVLECADCKLQFADPLKYSPECYNNAYDGTLESSGGMQEVIPYLGWTEEAQVGLPEWKNFLLAAQSKALHWIADNYDHPRNTVVLDLGCGQGWFLGALRSLEYDCYGMDVARKPVEVLRNKGFQVFCGTLQEFPSTWPVPAVITIFEVLEHLPNPVEFLSAVRTRFPSAAVILSVPSPNRWLMIAGRDEWDYPPNHLTRWNKQNLELALRTAGYQHVEVQILSPTVTEMSVVGARPFLRRWRGLPERTSTGCATVAGRPLATELRVRRIKRSLYLLPCVLLRLARKHAASILAIAT